MAKTIKGSVGASGANRPADVFTVQYLLNLVPKNQGGPSPELTVDAICGPLTSAAILKFQRASGSPCDGRVDPNGPTFRKLLSFDPYPMQDLSAAMAGKIGKAGSTAQKAAAEVILRKIGEELAKGHSQWMDTAGKLPHSPQAGIQGIAKSAADIIFKSTQAAAKVIEQAAKQGGLPVGPNPFGPPPEVKLQELIRRAFGEAQKMGEQMAKQAGAGAPPPALAKLFQQVADTAAKSIPSIAREAVKLAETAAKVGKILPPPAPFVPTTLFPIGAKVAGAIKQAAEGAAKVVEEAAKASTKWY